PNVAATLQRESALLGSAGKRFPLHRVAILHAKTGGDDQPQTCPGEAAANGRRWCDRRHPDSNLTGVIARFTPASENSRISSGKALRPYNLLHFPPSRSLSRASSPVPGTAIKSHYPSPLGLALTPTHSRPVTPHHELQAIKREHQLQTIKRDHQLELERLRLQARELQHDKALLTARTIRLERELSFHHHCHHPSFEAQPPTHLRPTFDRSHSHPNVIGFESLCPATRPPVLSSPGAYPASSTPSTSSPRSSLYSSRTSLLADHTYRPLTAHHSRSGSSSTNHSVSRPCSPSPSLKGILKHPRKPEPQPPTELRLWASERRRSLDSRN
ncbi:hypothetical protein CROQUDRAFT_91673, partial [Cronartium quercuum f. sp. fusiforme G11]